MYQYNLTYPITTKKPSFTITFIESACIKLYDGMGKYRDRLINLFYIIKIYSTNFMCGIYLGVNDIINSVSGPIKPKHTCARARTYAHNIGANHNNIYHCVMLILFIMFR